jgi:hypothetical protein
MGLATFVLEPYTDFYAGNLLGQIRNHISRGNGLCWTGAGSGGGSCEMNTSSLFRLSQNCAAIRGKQPSLSNSSSRSQSLC